MSLLEHWTALCNGSPKSRTPRKARVCLRERELGLRYYSDHFTDSLFDTQYQNQPISNCVGSQESKQGDGGSNLHIILCIHRAFLYACLFWNDRRSPESARFPNVPVRYKDQPCLTNQSQPSLASNNILLVYAKSGIGNWAISELMIFITIYRYFWVNSKIHTATFIDVFENNVLVLNEL